LPYRRIIASLTLLQSSSFYATVIEKKYLSLFKQKAEPMKKIVALALTSMLALGACAQSGEQNTWGMGNKQTIGTGAGAIVGGLLGSKVGGGSGQLWATGAGALLGAFAGSSIGQSLDHADKLANERAMNTARTSRLGEPIRWNNPNTGHSGTVTPVREGRNNATGNICREYKQSIYIDGRSQTAYGTACKNDDGTWSLANG
jgi:surface antigen